MSNTIEACPVPKQDNSELYELQVGIIRKTRREAVHAIAGAAVDRKDNEMSDLQNKTAEEAKQLSTTFDEVRVNLDENLKGKFANAAKQQLDKQKTQLDDLQ